MIDIIKVLMKKTRQKVAGSLKIKIPTSTLPTAPIPVQTAYAVPIGSSFVTFTSKTILIVRQTKNPAYQKIIVFPDDSLAFPRHVANATSNKPAIINSIQFILLVVKILISIQGILILNTQILKLFKFLIILMPIVIAVGF